MKQYEPIGVGTCLIPATNDDELERESTYWQESANDPFPEIELDDNNPSDMDKVLNGQ